MLKRFILIARLRRLTRQRRAAEKRLARLRIAVAREQAAEHA